MFERYTEKARRVIFFARYEASQYGSSTITPEHFFLGLVREDPIVVLKYVADMETRQQKIRASIPTQPRISTSYEMPLSEDSKRVLNAALARADELGQQRIGTEDLLLGVLAEIGLG